MYQTINELVKKAFYEIYLLNIDDIAVQRTRKEFKGDYSINIFPWVKQIRKNPEIIADEIGNYLKNNYPSIISSYEVIKGFINLCINDSKLYEQSLNSSIISIIPPKKRIVIEFSSPNTNKPLHLGHIRNNLLGNSISKILSAAGNEVIKVNLVNDRGIHICKSMLAWIKWGNNITPQKAGKKGDKLVGDFYVMFDKAYKAEVDELIKQGYTQEKAEKEAPLIFEAQELLRKWESNDKDTLHLWQTMNQWVYDGFNYTYNKLGISFDKIYYESETYQLGKQYILEGLKKGIFFKKEDGSVWIDLTNEGLDEKLLLRSDGTSVYITQDIGTAIARYNEYKPDLMIYVVGNEQNYHFQVLKLILKKLGFSWAECIYHLSYGMVELPHGKMKSREGTVVDADDLIEELVSEARSISRQLGKLKDENAEIFNNYTEKIALSALKYYILKVDPDKNMLFNPQESIDFDGNTGPFILYTFTRIQSLLNKAKEQNIDYKSFNNTPENIEKERELLKLLIDGGQYFYESCVNYNPGKIANYTYALAKEYNQYYQHIPILKEADETVRLFRLKLSEKVAEHIRQAFSLLGIEVIEKM